MNKFEYKKLTPFKWYVLQNFPFIEADFDMITEYQLYCKVVEYLNNTIDNMNLTGEQMENVTNAMTELQNYVNNYFKNLDVQEEINNKLNEMVEDGTLPTIMADYFNSNMQLIFPKFWTNAESCEFDIIKYKNKTIVFDLGMIAQYEQIKSMLIDNNISSFDYVIITHYDNDHIQNFENLYNDNYINSNTIIFFPAETNLCESLYPGRIAYYKSFCENENLQYNIPKENQIINIDSELSLKFYNCNKNILDNIYSDYNDTSTVTLITHRNNKILMTGDIGQKAQKRILEEFINQKIDFYKIPHHGINTQTSSYPQLIKRIRPDYAVQTGGQTLAKKRLFFNVLRHNNIKRGKCQYISLLYAK